MYHVDDLPDGVEPKDMVIVTMSVDYLIERDKLPEVREKARKGPGRGLTAFQQALESECMDVDATSLAQMETIACEQRGHLMPARKIDRLRKSPTYGQFVPTDPVSDCEDCISEAEAYWERVYSGG